MNSFTNKVGQLLAMLCLSTSFLHGSVSEESLSTPVGQTTVSEEERLAQTNFLAGDESEEVQVQERAAYDPFYPIDYSAFTVSTITYKGSSVALSDGSLWTIRPSDGWIVSGWNDEYNRNSYYSVGASRVYMTSNNSWISGQSYPYKMVNMDTGESVYCNISTTAPLENCIYIKYIDYFTGHIELGHANGFNTFYMSSFDKEIYQKWQAGDRVFYGRNSRWNSATSPYLIINFETMTNSRCGIN